MDESEPLVADEADRDSPNYASMPEPEPEPESQTSQDNASRGNVLTRHEQAAWIIDETTRGAAIPSPEGVPRTRKNRSAYLLFENSAWLRQAATFLLVMLSFFETPAWCSSTKVCVSPDSSEFFLSGIPYLSPLEAFICNIVLLGILVAFVIFDAIAFPVSLHVQPRLLRLLLAALILDMLYVSLFGGYPPVRFAPFLRVLLPLLYWHALRECTTSIFAVVFPFLDVVVFVAIFTIVFGWVVTLFFHDVPEAERYFGNLTVGLYSAFTSVTTADWPMQIMAVLDVSRPSALLFVFFIVIGVFLLFNVLLAVVYNAYTGHIETVVVEKLRARRDSICVAYDILCGDPNEGVVSLPDVKLLFDELRKNKKHSHLDDERVDLVFTALDDDADSHLSREEFLNIVDVLQLKFVIELSGPSPVERFIPQVYNTAVWQKISEFVLSPSFTYVIDAFMIFNVFVVIIETTMDLRGKDTASSVLVFSILECGFSIVYFLEMALKIGIMGFQRYWRDLGNRFDFWVAWILLIVTAYVLLPFAENDAQIVRYFILLRCLRLFTLLADIPRFRRLVQVFSILIPASVPLFTFFFLSLYVFSAAGVELFGGQIYKSNPKLNPELYPHVDAYVSNDYWALNFNDMASGWFTLFSSVIVAYLTEIAEAIASTSNYGGYTKWFFLLSFIVNTLIVSNCVVAFVVDLFVMEDESVDETNDLAANLQTRYGAKRVRVLAQKNTADQVFATMFRERVNEVFET